jgi:hypothetical protein
MMGSKWTENEVKNLVNINGTMMGSKWTENEVKNLVNINGNKKSKTKEVLFAKNNSGRVKGKGVPLQACSGPEGSRKLRFPDFMTTA